MAETAMVITSQGLQFSLPQIYAFACLETQQTNSSLTKALGAAFMGSKLK